jgi:DNA gyrase/topoisomerase IV subunit B
VNQKAKSFELLIRRGFSMRKTLIRKKKNKKPGQALARNQKEATQSTKKNRRTKRQRYQGKSELEPKKIKKRTCIKQRGLLAIKRFDAHENESDFKTKTGQSIKKFARKIPSRRSVEKHAKRNVALLLGFFPWLNY